MSRWLKNIFSIFVLGWVLFAFSAKAQMIFRAELSQTRLRVGEQTILNIVLEGEEVEAKSGVELPDLSPYFKVDGQIGPSVSTVMTIINGRMTKRTSWQIQYLLVANKVGSFTIPRLSYRSGSQTYYSNPIMVQILEPASVQTREGDFEKMEIRQDPFLSLELEPKEIFIGEQVIASWYLYFQRQIMELNLGSGPSLADFKVMELERSTQLSPMIKEHKGEVWNVAFIQSLALFPLGAGNVNVGSLELLYQQRAGRDFWGMPITKQEVVRSEPISITVKPLPLPSPMEFTGAVGKFEMRAEFSKKEARVNENLSLLVEIRGDGNPDYILEPKLNIPAEFELYPPEVKLETAIEGGRLWSKKRFEYVLVPRKEGNFQVPELRFCYFDPESRKYNYVKTEPISIKVNPGASGAELVSQGGLKTSELKADIRFIKPNQELLKSEGERAWQEKWIGLIQVLGIALVGLAYWYRAYLIKLEGDEKFRKRQRAFREFKGRLKQAKKLAGQNKEGEFVSELKSALLQYLGDRLGISPWGLLEEEMAEVMEKNSVPKEKIKEFLVLLKDLNRFQFGKAISGVSSKELLEKSESLISTLEKVKQ